MFFHITTYRSQYYPFKIFRRFRLATIPRLIRHNQLALTIFERCEQYNHRFDGIINNYSTTVRVIIIPYPTSASGIIVLLKTPTKYREFFPTSFVKTADFQLVLNFE